MAKGDAKPAKKADDDEEEVEPEEVDYSTSGPDIKFHKKVSNALFCAAILGILGMLVTLVFLDLRKTAASGKHALSLGTSKGR
jgi:hypothetical protein